ncbi:MAG: ABC transporter permease [Chloroflexi bacterium]|nr:ABC transporter permease [Chloroflexota bacterium]
MVADRAAQHGGTLGGLGQRPAQGALVALARFAQQRPLGGIGLGLVLVACGTAVFASVLSPFDPLDLHGGQEFVAPGAQFWLGTDNVGRDILSRILYGGRISLYVGLVAVLVGNTLGSLAGLVSAYFGGMFDTVLQRVVDAMMAFPLLVLALAIVAVLGPSVNNVVAAISVILFPQAARVIRSAVLSIKENPYVDAARAIGAGQARIIFMHVLPQCMAPYLVLASTAIGWAIVVEASISFLGAGPPPPTPTWGGMLSGAARLYAESAPWMVVFPGLAISLAVFGFNLLGDALRDVLDPRLRGSQ